MLFVSLAVLFLLFVLLPLVRRSHRHLPQRQPVGRRGLAVECRTPAVKRVAHRIRVCSTEPDTQQGCHDPADHPAQEGVSDNLHRDQLASLPNLYPVQRPNRLPVPPPESGEIVPTYEHLCRLAHRLQVEWPLDAECVPLPERALRSVPDQISVLAIPGPVARPEVHSYPAQRPDGDVAGKCRRERLVELSAVEAAAVGERDHLSTSVDAGIRAPRSLDRYPASCRELGECRFELSLDGPGLGLDLEACEVSAVIFDPRAVPNGAALSGDLCYVG